MKCYDTKSLIIDEIDKRSQLKASSEIISITLSLTIPICMGNRWTWKTQNK